MNYKILISFLAIYFSINSSFAKSIEQYFIKIIPSSNQVKYGKLIVKRYNSSLNYQKEENLPELTDPKVALEWINKQISPANLNKHSKVLIFIHGFWGSFPYAIDITSKAFDKYYFKNDDSNIDAVIHIIWKSHNMTYNQAIKSLKKSSNTLADILNNVEMLYPEKYSLICHSMGSRFLFESISNHTIKTKFQELVLIAPDLSLNNFNDNKNLFLNLASKIYVFANKNDQILLISKYINKNERLGRVTNHSKVINIEFINCSDVYTSQFNIDYMTSHLCFLYSPKVRKKIESVLDM
ncbi:MAG TPA: alpha/beta hydrolase [Bacteroidetes bacterium]|nr:alpha/beta hydrolase [Bacteroidota bacterium]